MIKTDNLTKLFDDFVALDHVSTTIDTGSIYGLVGANGAGKSTLLRIFAGIYQASDGSVNLDGSSIYENISSKSRISYVPDDLFFEDGMTMELAAKKRQLLYPNWSTERYEKLCSLFPLPPKQKLLNCSKGMRREAALILALSTMPDYLFLDEAFDGLDPVLRAALRKILSDDVSQRNTTVIISSHNLRELEDVCDNIAMLYNGKILFQRSMDDLKCNFCRIQFARKPLPSREEIAKIVEILAYKESSSVAEIVAVGQTQDVIQKLQVLNPLLCEGLALNLEEVFIYEMEAAGYDYSNIIF